MGKFILEKKPDIVTNVGKVNDYVICKNGIFYVDRTDTSRFIAKLYFKDSYTEQVTEILEFKYAPAQSSISYSYIFMYLSDNNLYISGNDGIYNVNINNLSFVKIDNIRLALYKNIYFIHENESYIFLSIGYAGPVFYIDKSANKLGIITGAEKRSYIDLEDKSTIYLLTENQTAPDTFLIKCFDSSNFNSLPDLRLKNTGNIKYFEILAITGFNNHIYLITNYYIYKYVKGNEIPIEVSSKFSTMINSVLLGDERIYLVNNSTNYSIAELNLETLELKQNYTILPSTLAQGGPYLLQKMLGKRYLKLQHASTNIQPVIEFILTAPIISGTNEDLGTINDEYLLEFNVNHLDKDMLSDVKIYLDDKILKDIENITYNKDISILIDPKTLQVGNYEIRIEAVDSWGDKSERIYTFEKTNTPPRIITEANLGDVIDDIKIVFKVEDDDLHDVNSVNVGLYLDESTTALHEYTPVKLREELIYTIPIQDLELGEHSLLIKAVDKFGEVVEETVTWNKINSSPIISGRDEDLGAKNEPFKIILRVTDKNNDIVRFIARVNQQEPFFVNEDIQLGVDLEFEITREMLYALELNKRNVIEFSARDEKGGESKRYKYFTRTNSLPEIITENENLGDLAEPFELEYSMKDVEGDHIYRRYVLDDEILKVDKLESEVTEKFKFTEDEWLSIEPNSVEHQFKIQASDQEDFAIFTEKVKTFKRLEDRMEFIIDPEISTERFEFTIVKLQGEIAAADDFTIEVTNNFYDDNPVWEDFTQEINTNAEKYFIKNKEKTAEHWGLAFRIKCVEGGSGQVSNIPSIQVFWGFERKGDDGGSN